MRPFVQSALFADAPQHMPEVNRDDRRVITELTTDLPGGKKYRISRIAVIQQGAVLGNHYHTGPEKFRGRGSGKVTLVPTGCLVAPRDLPVFTHELPPDGWELTVEAGMVHAFVFDGPPDQDGVVAVLVSETDFVFVDDPQKGKVNTFRHVLVNP